MAATASVWDEFKAVGYGTVDSVPLFGKERLAWDCRAAELAHPFLMSGWLVPWAQAFMPVGAKPLASMWITERGAPLLQSRGRVVRAATNVHSPISGALCSDASRLSEGLPTAVRRVIWPRLDEQDAVLIAAALRADGWLARVEHQHVSPIVWMAKSHQDFERSLSRNLRQRGRRLERKLCREESAALQVALPADEPALFDRCLRLEASGWKGRQSTAILSQRDTAFFYRAVAQQPSARLFVLGSPLGLLAFALCLIHGQRLFLIKTSYDEQRRSCSPGLVLHYALIRWCHEMSLRSYELLGRADPWKVQFANGERRIGRVLADRRTIAGFAHQSLRIARPSVKTAVARFKRLR
jgi:CelD/BcsL family acetyltransferase involved in cellulose biosynthesis